jgi:cytochrome P450
VSITDRPPAASQSDSAHDRLFGLDPEAVSCPYPIFAELRHQAPVVWVEEIESFVVTRYEDVAHVLRHPEAFSSAMATGPVLARQIAEGIALLADQPEAGGADRMEAVLSRVARGRTRVLLTADPPLHRRQRNLVNRSFTQRRVREWDGTIRGIAEDLVTSFPAEGPVEFVQAFAVPLPLSVIADRLGVPRSDMANFKKWSDDFTVAIGNHQLGPDELRSMLVSQSEFFEYFEAMVERRRAEPGDDLVSDLVQARLPDGDELDLPELLGMINQFLVAGNETTTKLLAFSVRRLADDPDMAGRLRADHSLIEPFIEEMLRLEAPVQGLYRQAVEDCTVGGTAIRAGASLWLAYASANHDDEVFACPGDLELDRTFTQPHLAFGFGEHFCLGAALARAEARIGISVLLDRLDPIVLAPGNRFQYEPSYALHGLRELWLTVTPKP